MWFIWSYVSVLGLARCSETERDLFHYKNVEILDTLTGPIGQSAFSARAFVEWALHTTINSTVVARIRNEGRARERERERERERRAENIFHFTVYWSPAISQSAKGSCPQTPGGPQKTILEWSLWMHYAAVKHPGTADMRRFVQSIASVAPRNRSPLPRNQWDFYL